MTDLLDQGITPYLHDEVRVSIETYFDGDLEGKPANFQHLAKPGRAGWEIVGVVPITSGGALMNNSVGSIVGTSYGAAYGGQVVPFYLLLRFPVTKSLLENSRVFVAEHLCVN